VAGERHDAAFVVGAIIGGAAGATYALLNAPQAGRRTRAQLAEGLDAIAQRLLDAATALQSFLQERGGPDADRAVGEPAPTAGEPLITLPDPLEPDPVAGGPAAPDTPPVALTGADPTPDADVVLDGPRPTDPPPAPPRDPGATAPPTG
jgi:YtxH-like protein